MTRTMPLAARRVLRLAFATALALAVAYAINRPLQYLAPLMTFMLVSSPGPPLKAKQFIGLLFLVLVSCGTGLMITPLLTKFPTVGLTLVAVGLYLANRIVAKKGQNVPALLFTVGLTMITVAGTASFALALMVVGSLLFAIVIAVLCQLVGHLIFPDEGQPVKATVAETHPSNELHWRALRATLIVLPSYLLALVNPMMYMPLILKSLAMGQQESVGSARAFGREIIESTLLAGVLAVLFWWALKLHPSLWLFCLWMLLFGLYIASKLYGVSETRYPPSFWIPVAVNLLILVGPAVTDSANGDDVYKAFAVRFTLFLAVSIYAFGAVSALESLRRGATEEPHLTVTES